MLFHHSVEHAQQFHSKISSRINLGSSAHTEHWLMCENSTRGNNHFGGSAVDVCIKWVLQFPSSGGASRCACESAPNLKMIPYWGPPNPKCLIKETSALKCWGDSTWDQRQPLHAVHTPSLSWKENLKTGLVSPPLLCVPMLCFDSCLPGVIKDPHVITISLPKAVNNL